MTDIKSLKKEIEYLENETNRLSCMEQAVKIVLNGGYGALGTNNFRWYDETIAEGITATGQVAIRYISNKINEFVNKESNADIFSDAIVSSDTDSVVGSTMINVNGKDITISDYYDNANNEFIKYDEFNSDYVKKICNDDITQSMGADSSLNNNRINYVMKHLVKKRFFKITLNGESVEITEDHSIIVKMKNSNKIKSIKPSALDKSKHFLINIVRTDSDRVVTINEQKNEFII